MEAQWGTEFFVTSLRGEEALVYPLPVWEEFEEGLRKMGLFNPVRMRIQKVVNFYGQTQSMDSQGRILIQPQLREKAGLQKEVAVLGSTDHLYVQGRERIETEVEEPISAEELAALDALLNGNGGTTP